ncbi:putative cytochrome P450 [Rosa chinensis]|uniref:Putative cytochrome P450 n=1 Tax=Rosa chinensis TaxID=74649 RepID=A0A2P6QBK8_ROSCH|nr:cytochrome P450 736A117 [Rosa chinensis]PRQ31553.1 putative cytochrome P450 [Rosa chinensis]
MPHLLQMLELKLNQFFLIPLESFSFKYLLLSAIFLILLYRWSSHRNSSVPPSPPKLPIIGNLHQVGLLPHRSLQTLSQRHGPVMLLHFGSRPVLVISSAEAASQIFKTHDLIFSDRPKFIFFEKVIYNYKDIVTAPYGEYWRQLRSLCVLNLLSNKRVRSFRAVRQEETRLMISNILQSCSTISSSSSSSSPVLNLSDIFMKLSNDLICRVAMGRKYSDLGEDGGKMFMKIAGDLTEFFTRVNIGDYIPWLAWFTRLSGFDAELDDLAKRADAFFDMVIQEHIDKSMSGIDGMNDNEDQKDFVDVLLAVQKENAVGVPIDRVGIKAIILDMFTGGSDTTFTTLEWLMSELMKNPRVMKKLQNEVRGVVGNKEDITEDDLVRMHYLKAVIKETFRLHPPLPLLVPRMSNQNAKINGYNIKANTQVMVNAWAIGRDPKSYTNAEQYEPERFLNSAIDFKGNDFELIPFGSGRRGCPGMHFAVVGVEIVLANIVHKFDWILPDGARAEDLDMSESTGITAHRKYPLKAVAKPYISCF